MIVKERALKAQYDNRKLFKRLREIEDKPMPTFSSHEHRVGHLNLGSIRRNLREKREIAK